MLSDDMVQPSVMLLINAFAIDLEWVTVFDKYQTTEQLFYMDDGRKMKTAMMSKKVNNNDLFYYINESITAITMDLKENNGTQLEFMAIMLKRNLSNFADLSCLSISLIWVFDTFSTEFVNDGVTLKMPKFKFSYDLKQDLIKLGIKDAFD